MNLIQHIDKNNLHHAYLIEGSKDEVIPQILIFLESIDVEIVGNPDFHHISLDSFKIEDARNLKSLGAEKSFSKVENKKKVFIISVNNFLLEAQNTLLKMFEEPKDNTLFFLVVPEADTLLKTLVSRFYLIKNKGSMEGELKEVEKFVSMSTRDRVDFLKEFVALSKEEEEEGDRTADSTRSKALKFLNLLEVFLHRKIFGQQVNKNTSLSFFEHFFKVREFLRQPGSSAKSLLESIALSVPRF